MSSLLLTGFMGELSCGGKAGSALAGATGRPRDKEGTATPRSTERETGARRGASPTPSHVARQAQPQGARQDVRPIGLARLEEAVLPPGPQLPRNPRLEEGPRRPRLPPLPLVRLSENCLPPPGTAPSGQPELWDPLVWPAL